MILLPNPPTNDKPLNTHRRITLPVTQSLAAPVHDHPVQKARHQWAQSLGGRDLRSETRRQVVHSGWTGDLAPGISAARQLGRSLRPLRPRRLMPGTRRRRAVRAGGHYWAPGTRGRTRPILHGK